ncbi:Mariner Mos1 transposase [Eumeta japonica]|uniref:Mariner Mos1 transposase n=1 Tax=Eumeta variegata TaxID=151549 RepID=A0A4C1VJE5_EUMVA|nr:Mariner Mos1 transposase [Eumeta japonica]
MTPLLAQTLTGHGGLAQYLHRFKLTNSPYCACAPDKIQDLLHVLEECSIFLKERAEIEVGTGVRILRKNFFDLLSEEKSRKMFLRFCEGVVYNFASAVLQEIAVAKQGHWVLYKLMPRYVERRLFACEQLLARQRRKGFLHHIVTGDEKWAVSMSCGSGDGRTGTPVGRNVERVTHLRLYKPEHFRHSLSVRVQRPTEKLEEERSSPPQRMKPV